MVNIVHKVGIKAPISTVFKALTTTEGVAGWWTKDTSGSSQEMLVRFPNSDGSEKGRMNFELTGLEANKHVEWRFTDGPQEWMGTHVSFDLHEADGYCIVLFAHRNWKEAIEFTHHCSTKWAIFLMSLKEYLETGKGKPAPYDIKIDNWN